MGSALASGFAALQNDALANIPAGNFTGTLARSALFERRYGEAPRPLLADMNVPHR
jgi:hypothetical protein